MKATKQQFMTLLSMTMEDMEADVEDLMKHCEAQREEHTISDYVSRENMTVYENLRAGIRCMRKLLEQVDVESHAEIEDLIKALESRCREHLVEGGYAGGLASTLKRKMERIVQYIHEQLD